MAVSYAAIGDDLISIAEPDGRLRNRLFGARWLPDTTIGLVAAGLALLLPVLTLRTALAPAWTPRYALLGLEAACGLPAAFALLRTRLRRTALTAVGFAGVATVSTLASDNPAMSFFGMELWGTGLLFVFALVGAWALGACAGPRGVRGIEQAILVGVGVNCLVVVTQSFVDLSFLGVLQISGQRAGLLGQPVALGAFLVGGMWLVGRRAIEGSERRWLAMIVAIAACIELSGERLPLLLLPLVLVALLRRCPRRRAAPVVLAVVLGVAVGWGIGFSASAQSATTRVTGSRGDEGRVENDITALRALVDRPILGWGPGRYQAATSQYRTRALEVANPDVLYADAHNSLLQYGVTTGIVGLGLLAAWVVLAFRRASGPLVGFSALIMIVQLVQPQDVGLTPLALLALGAAAAVPAPRRAVPMVFQAAMISAAFAFAALIVVGGYREWRAINGSHSDAVAVAGMLPHWPDRTVLAEKAFLTSSEGSASDRIASARDWSYAGIARDERDVRMYEHAALFDVLASDPVTAQRHVDAGVTLSPWSPIALTDRAALEEQSGDKTAAIATLQQVLEIEPDYDLARRMLQSLTSP